ncbi:hypothetical protein ACFY2M_44040 [Streptomyces sp. NPDC001276]|uniref:hypothetical protein n=1 Tax=Streptomyces sp. NPDC001276 TaxID=3364555 RepID=UPI0036C7E2EA
MAPLGPHADVHPHYLADLPSHDWSSGLTHSGADALVVRRKQAFIRARLAVRDQHHCPAAHLPGHRPEGDAFVGELPGHRSKDTFGDGEFVPLGPHFRKLFGQLFFEFIQFRATRGDPFQQLGIQHGPDRRRPPGRCE